MGRVFCGGACAGAGAGFAWLWELGGNKVLESTMEHRRTKARWPILKTFLRELRGYSLEGNQAIVLTSCGDAEWSRHTKGKRK